MDSSDLTNPYLGVFVKYHTYVGRHLADYHDIKNQLRLIKQMSDYYSRKYKVFKEKYLDNPNPTIHIPDDDIYSVQCTFVSIVISYAKCFDTSRIKNGDQSRRLIKLNGEFIRNISDSSLEVHNELLKLRNELIAHAGAGDYENYEYLIGYNEQGQSTIKKGDNYTVITSTYVEFDKLGLLIEEITTEVDRKIEVLFEKVQEELLIISHPDKQDVFLSRLCNGIPITNIDLK